MDKEEIIKYCLTLENTYKDCPFSDDFESVTMKHCKNKKWFALLMNVNNKLYLNVKTDPNYSDILRNTYDYIIPAYHMNKEHWNTIIIDEKVDNNSFARTTYNIINFFILFMRMNKRYTFSCSNSVDANFSTC